MSAFGIIVAGAAGLLLGVPLLLWVLQRPVRGLYVAIFASGILITPELPAVREKFAGTEVMMLSTWAAMLAWALMGAPLARGRLQPIQGTALLWGGLFTATAITSFSINNLVTSGAFFVYSAVETANYVYGFLAFTTVVMLVDDPPKWDACVLAWILGAAVVVAVGVWASVGGAPAWTRDEFTHRISSTLKTENQVPSFLVPVLVVIAFRASFRSTAPYLRLFYAALSAGMAVVLLGTGSRTGFLLLIIGVAAVFYLTTRRGGRRAFHPGLIYGAGALLAGGLAMFTVQTWTDSSLQYRLGEIPPHLRPVLLLRELVAGERDLDAGRMRQIDTAKEFFLDEALLGTGPGNFSRTYGMAEIHNTYLGVLMQQGIPGLMALLIWIWTVYRAGVGAGRMTNDAERKLLIDCMLIGFGLLLLYGLTIYGLRQRNIWLMMGLLAALPRVVLAEAAERRASIAETDAHPDGAAGAPTR